MLDVSGGLTERCGCEEVKRPFWNHSGGSKSFVQDQVCVLMQSKQFAKQQTNKVFGPRAGSYKEASLHLTARTSAERPSSDQPAAKPWQLRQRLG